MPVEKSRDSLDFQLVLNGNGLNDLFFCKETRANFAFRTARILQFARGQKYQDRSENRRGHSANQKPNGFVRRIAGEKSRETRTHGVRRVRAVNEQCDADRQQRQSNCLIHNF
jgi:hypothetical protein